MKYIIIATAVALTLGAAASASAQSSSGGTITFTGAINDATCTISGGAGSSGGAGNFAVALDPVNADQLAAAGDIAAPKRFDVVIGGPGQGTCVDGKVATMSFLSSSSRIDPVTGALANSLTGEATNVQIQLADGVAAAPINLADPTNGSQATITNNTATIPYFAQYLAVNGASTPGLVSTSVVYAVRYN